MIITNGNVLQRHPISLPHQLPSYLFPILAVYLFTVLFIEFYWHASIQLLLSNNFFIHQLVYFICMLKYIRKSYYILILIFRTCYYLLESKHLLILLLVLFFVWIWPSIVIQALDLAAPISRFRGFGPSPPSQDEVYIAMLSGSKILDNNVHFKKVGLLIFHSASDDTLDQLLSYRNVNNNNTNV